MGEIKSTLDLVMERTGHLSLSEEEKAQQRQADFEKRLQGLLNRYDDQVLSVDGLKIQIEELKKELKITDEELVTNAVFGRIDPDGQNQRWLDLIGELKPSVLNALEGVLSDYRRHQENLIYEGRQRMQDHLARHRGIKGTAVVPNPLKEDQYRENAPLLKNEIRRQIKTL